MLDWLVQPRNAARAVMLVFAVLVFAFAVLLSAYWRSGGHGADLMLSAFLPMPLYLWAVWSARRAILLIGSGGGLRTILSSMLRRIGWALFAAGLVRTFAVPWLLRLVHGSGSIATFDPAAITIGVIGLTLVIVAGVVREAEAARAELDEFL